MTQYLYNALKKYTGAEGQEAGGEDRWEHEHTYPMHMPGHKRRLGSLCDPFAIDITEIDGFDNLHHAEGILREAQQRAAELYESEETHFLVNGSTGGILAAVSGAVAAGRRSGRNGLLMARSCHKAAYHAAYLCDVDPVWLYPRQVRTESVSLHSEADMGTADQRPTGRPIGGVRRIKGMVQDRGNSTLYGAGQHSCSGFAGNQDPAVDPGLYLGGRIAPEDVEQALQEHPECAAVMIVSPTYDGVISDVGRIARIAHRHHAVLIVDEAHGAHYGLDPELPPSSVQLGADLVIHSLHKTLPSLTQTALLHVNGSLVDRELVRRYLQIYQTSSPSYVLMASIDECIRSLALHADVWFQDYRRMLDRFYESVQDLRMLQVVCPDDPSKILIFPGSGAEDQLSGNRICDILRASYRLEPEMAVPSYVLALISVGDDEEGLVRLSRALHEIDKECYIRQRFGKKQAETADTYADSAEAAEDSATREAEESHAAAGYPQRVLRLRQAWDAVRVSVPIAESAGRIAGEPAYLYPPGIPVIVPGERITMAQANWMSRCLAEGYELHGLEDTEGRHILAVDEEALPEGAL